jgi:hypothetical protein
MLFFKKKDTRKMEVETLVNAAMENLVFASNLERII